VIPASRQRNYLQSGLYVIVAGILAALLLERLLTYAEAIEKAKMEVTLSRLHTGLYAQLAFLALRGEKDAYAVVVSGSPFQALKWRPSEYLGEFDGVPPGDHGGKWFFDEAKHELVYTPSLSRHLVAESSGSDATRLRYRLEIQRSKQEAFVGVSLRSVNVFRWDPL